MNAPATVVRLARADDAAAIATIYNEGIADRVATFETEPRTPEQIARQLADKGDRYPTVVVDRGGQIVAWAAGLIGTGRRMPESPSTRCMSHGVRAAPVRGVRLWRDSFVSTPNAASGRSCPG